MILMSLLDKIEIQPIGFVKRSSTEDDERDRTIISKIVLREDLTNALDGIDEFSHIFVIFWLDQLSRPEKPIIHHPSKKCNSIPIGIFATRAPVHPNPIGLTLVELIKRKNNIIWVKGLDALDNSPILDIKPYPDWEKGKLQVIVDFRIPGWLNDLLT